MQIPQEYQKNLDKKIITFEMINDCLYSCNKKAKNFRDQARLVRKSDELGDIINEQYLKEVERNYYDIKENLLRVFKPTCIHHEIYNTKYDGKQDYYYLFYDLEEHSYHIPIEKSEIKKYPTLEVVHLTKNILTKGKNINTLLPDSFVNQVNNLVNSGEYQLKFIQPKVRFISVEHKNKKLLN